MTQKEALDILKMGHNVFLTGRAGSGKTHVLNQYISFLREQEASVGVTASTGIAATHLNGITLHSWTGMGILDELSEKDLGHILRKKYLSKRLKNTQVLIIDEISMLSAKQFDVADKILRAYRQTDEPFGGMQIVLCGDFFQLPPISKNNDKESNFAYHAEAWEDLNLKICYLSEQHRHTDEELLSVLEAIRTNSVSESILDLLRARYRAPIDAGTKLYTHNFNVDAINNKHLAELPGSEITYSIRISGSNTLAEILSKNMLASRELSLKKDALVMFVKNNFDLGYANGTMGRIVDFNDQNFPIVKTKEGNYIEVFPESWAIEEDGKVKAEVEQVPLRLAWAITVHKSQGMTLDAAEIDLSKSFEPGMGYVALSRVRSLDGMRIMGMNEIALMVNEEVAAMDVKFQELSAIEAEELNNSETDKIEEQKSQWKNKTQKTNKKTDTTEETRRLIASGLTIKEVAEARNLAESTILGHIEKFLQKGDKTDISHLNTIPAMQFDAMKEALLDKANPEMKLSPARKKLGNKYSFDELRFARLFLYGETGKQ